MLEPFLRRLRQVTGAPERDLLALASAVDRTVEIGANAEIVQEGQRTLNLHLIIDGWACRYKHLADGRRHIPALLLPGDIADVDASCFERSTTEWRR